MLRARATTTLRPGLLLLLLMADSAADLQRALDAAHEFSVLWKFQFNCDRGKTESMVFLAEGEAADATADLPPFLMGNTPLHRAVSYKYLGVHLTPDLSWDTHRQEMECRALRSKNQLVWVGGRQAGELIEAAYFNRLYEMVARPGFEYASELWGAAPLGRLEWYNMTWDATFWDVAHMWLTMQYWGS